jgi:hypothetical protein
LHNARRDKDPLSPAKAEARGLDLTATGEVIKERPAYRGQVSPNTLSIKKRREFGKVDRQNRCRSGRLR